ncbi:basic helix-loop-helix (bHLH) DNA-binding superfamily protein [Artemisia annua]|uniref:Basic helix-loop-helix (BHLH) DNA-binding superfamily protein n=1 Tax=Artemisia annua TaxID=35608 RepID=A0A2U1PMN2_ARTAN|nr:basic helix-loop-helix (bHLH) DNA-binding superfamily protein [Artemisia annua]
MADNWWDSSSRTRPSLDSLSVSNSINLFQDSETATAATTTTTAATSMGGGTGASTSLHMMGLGLSSPSLPQSLDWNQALVRGDQKGDGGFRNLLEDQDHSLSSSTDNFPLENNQWRQQKMYSASSQDSSSDFKQINVRGFQLDQPMHDSDNESIITCQGLNSSFQSMDLYGSPSTIMQSLFGSDNNQQQLGSRLDQNQGMSYSLYQSSYGGINMPGGGNGGGGGGGAELSTSNWSKFPPQPQEFVVNSPSKVQLADMSGSQLHFANNARFWNPSAGGVNDIRPPFFPSLQMQLPTSTFEDKPKIAPKVVKESTSESSSSSTKRPRTENQSPLPGAFKVKKEKMGDRITALQQLVSPFGKTDTASVLSEAIEYIKFLHEQVSVLSTPYMKNGAAMMQQQAATDKPPDGPRQDLRSRGLCLVPVSSTFPVTHETTVDFWTPTFGGTFR